MQESELKRPGRAILIAGPTASGKSALALSVAVATGGVVVNVDSMQVYSVLNRLTARPQAGELAAVEHRLYGHVVPHERYSAGRFLEDMRALMAEPDMARRTMVLVGGTGLYFRALLGGLAEIPAVPEEVRRALTAELCETGPEALHRRLQELDPQAARTIQPTDSQRIVRALAVHAASGVALSEWQARPGKALIEPQMTGRFILEPDRKVLGARIEQRFRQMLHDGVIEEVRALDRLGLDPNLPAMKAIGVRELQLLDEGKLSVEAAVEQAAAATRRYAKRQATWFRHQAGPEWTRLGMDERKNLAALVLDGAGDRA